MTPHIEPIPVAAPATVWSPGAWDRAIPPAAPMNIPGNTGLRR